MGQVEEPTVSCIGENEDHLSKSNIQDKKTIHRNSKLRSNILIPVTRCLSSEIFSMGHYTSIPEKESLTVDSIGLQKGADLF